jgi:deazaflavin-dependent oxidoreductase (nitroreductase family)
MTDRLLRRIFKALNRYFMVPMFRLGLGFFVGTPFGGYIMVLRTVGRKTGKVRSAPVNYAIMDGHIYCLSGFGKVAHWYRNLQANPHLEVIMPGGALAGMTEDVVEEAERLRAIRQVLKNAGFAGFFEGFNPRTISDEALLEKTQRICVLRIHPTGLGSGAGDPGGWAWINAVAATVAIVLVPLLWRMRARGRASQD